MEVYDAGSATDASDTDGGLAPSPPHTSEDAYGMKWDDLGLEPLNEAGDDLETAALWEAFLAPSAISSTASTPRSATPTPTPTFGATEQSASLPLTFLQRGDFTSPHPRMDDYMQGMRILLAGGHRTAEEAHWRCLTDSVSEALAEYFDEQAEREASPPHYRLAKLLPLRLVAWTFKSTIDDLIDPCLAYVGKLSSYLRSKHATEARKLSQARSLRDRQEQCSHNCVRAQALHTVFSLSEISDALPNAPSDLWQPAEEQEMAPPPNYSVVKVAKVWFLRKDQQNEYHVMAFVRADSVRNNGKPSLDTIGGRLQECDADRLYFTAARKLREELLLPVHWQAKAHKQLNDHPLGHTMVKVTQHARKEVHQVYLWGVDASQLIGQPRLLGAAKAAPNTLQFKAAEAVIANLTMSGMGSYAAGLNRLLDAHLYWRPREYNVLPDGKSHHVPHAQQPPP